MNKISFLELTVALILIELIYIGCETNNGSDIAADKSKDTKSEWTTDAVWQNIVDVAVQDIIQAINDNKSLHNFEVDPLDMNSLIGESLKVTQWVMGYNVNMSMWDLDVYGLTDVKKDQVRVERNTDLSQLRARIMVQVDQLHITGNVMVM